MAVRFLNTAFKAVLVGNIMVQEADDVTSNGRTGKPIRKTTQEEKRGPSKVISVARIVSDELQSARVNE